MSLAEIHTGFAGSLFDALAGAGELNVVVSPWSVSSALAVLAAGVDDAARREIEHVLAARVTNPA